MSHNDPYVLSNKQKVTILNALKRLWKWHEMFDATLPNLHGHFSNMIYGFTLKYIFLLHVHKQEKCCP